MRRTILFTASLATAAGLFALGATAQQQAGSGPVPTPMSIAEIATLLEGQGYTVREIEFERDRYDVEMIDGAGRRIEAYLDPLTGEVLPYRDGHDDDDRYKRYDD
ncbi:PepSY domain-containing protein [Celeribacter neptunius]|uniref:Peptidase propeptide and YPEB domain-containing protein n=1 Tax=Celeribacter neptunius TaxID=588602 RepID=A0A1I3R8U0_9RHOB|nr:PepSY domain-containing protein [Celeribacter neptunius]SFJ42182.1 Peptidase propeptide and YPEB domain-containing protein [Celeribacter neptunius]